MEIPTYFVVFCYCDYRKEVDIQHLKVFTDKDKAIEFAKKYSSSTNSDPESVGPCGTEYDHSFIDDEEGAYENARKELSINNNMWYIRIAVSKVNGF